MSRYDRREYQRPDPPHPERERPAKRRAGAKPWKLEGRWVGPDAWFPRDREWKARSRYRTEADAMKALASKNRPGDVLLRGCYQYRVVGPDGQVVAP